MNARHGTTNLPVGTVHTVAFCPDCGEEITQKVEYNPPSGVWPGSCDWTTPIHHTTHCLANRLSRLERIHGLK